MMPMERVQEEAVMVTALRVITLLRLPNLNKVQIKVGRTQVMTVI
jgi:hypothetical protein